ncbi:MAG TPA: hypothetical protein VEX65_11750, partial [Flavisolibacter sp.]|nr:hypothetical protein [Flavisolibacter sp.]
SLIGLNEWFNRAFGAMLFFVFAWFIGLVERKELQRLPYLGRFFGATDTPGPKGVQRQESNEATRQKGSV